MKLGQLEFHVLVDGHLGLDGGAMFGVIPKPMWEKKIPADGRNRIKLAMNCLLVRAGGKTILVETGAGEKWDEKRRDIYALDGPHLTERLRDYGVHPHEIDIVINTHLHFDHCGGNTRVEKDKIVTAFPHARYVVQRGEYEHAKSPNERDRASYMLENYVPLEAAGKWSLLVDDRAIAPGVELDSCPRAHREHAVCEAQRGRANSVFLCRSRAHYGSPGAPVDHGFRLVSGDYTRK